MGEYRFDDEREVLLGVVQNLVSLTWGDHDGNLWTGVDRAKIQQAIAAVEQVIDALDISRMEGL